MVTDLGTCCLVVDLLSILAPDLKQGNHLTVRRLHLVNQSLTNHPAHVLGQ